MQLKNKTMKSKQEMENWMRDEVSNPMIGALIRNMVEDGLPFYEIMEIMQPLIDNTPNVEKQLVDKALRIQDADAILSTLKNKPWNDIHLN
jgi:hypothetical protein